MSVSALAWAFAQRIHPPHLKFLLVCLADRTSHDNTAIATIRGLIDDTSLEYPQVKDGITELAARSLLRTISPDSLPKDVVNEYNNEEVVVYELLVPKEYEP
jgi:hypothetical protein